MNLIKPGTLVKIVYVRKGYDSLQQYLNTTAIVISGQDDGEMISYLLVTSDGKQYLSNHTVSFVEVN